jgi:hypothetical protein
MKLPPIEINSGETMSLTCRGDIVFVTIYVRDRWAKSSISAALLNARPELVAELVRADLDRALCSLTE